MSKLRVQLTAPQQKKQEVPKDKSLENMKTANMLKIIEELEAESKNGNKSAQFILGSWYFLIGTRETERRNENFAEALKWLQLSEVHYLSDMLIQTIVSCDRNLGWYSSLLGMNQPINLYRSGPMPTPNPPMPMPTHPMPMPNQPMPAYPNNLDND